MPNFDLGLQGNYVEVRLPEAAMLGMHLDDADQMPLQSLDDPRLKEYSVQIREQMLARVVEVLGTYSKEITTRYKDIKEEVWLSDTRKLIRDLSELEFWRKKFEDDLTDLNLASIYNRTLPNLKNAFEALYESYQANSLKSTNKLEAFRQLSWPVRILKKYPLFLLLLLVTLATFGRFIKREKRDLQRVFTKSYHI